MSPVPRPLRAFTLIELLVSLAIVTLLVSVMLPALAGARTAARTVRCTANLRSLAGAWSVYAGDSRGRAMPLAYWEAEDIGSGDPVFWWGSIDTAESAIDPDSGFIIPYLDARPGERSVFECPEQPWGTYVPQGGVDQVTSTYGYNGYYLSPAKTPGWGLQIGTRPWRRLSDIERPTELFVFADTLLPLAEAKNTALLDPPMLYQSGGWSENWFPTTAFRHDRAARGAGSSVTARADGSIRGVRARPGDVTKPIHVVGSVGETPAPHYVPDWKEW